MSRRPVRRSPASAPVVVSTPQPPEREHHYPAWFTRASSGSVNHSTDTLDSVVKAIRMGVFRLPRFQRPYVWTDEQVIRLFDSFFCGYHVGSLLVWERHDLPASREVLGGVEVACPAGGGLLVVDGQQRIGAIAAVALSGRFWFHTRDGRLTTEGPGPWLAPAAGFLTPSAMRDMFDEYKQHAAEHRLDPNDVLDAWTAVLLAMERAQISSIRIGGFCSRGWDLPRVMESFRRLNTEGTPMDPGHLEAALARALEGSPS